MNEKIIVYIDPELKDLIPEYLGNRHKDIESIIVALEKNDYNAIQILGHSMKGSGGGFGFDAITDIGKSLEQAAKDNNREEIHKYVLELKNYLKRIKIVFE